VSRKGGSYGFFCSGKRQIANIKFGHFKYSRVGMKERAGMLGSRTFPRWRHLVREKAPECGGDQEQTTRCIRNALRLLQLVPGRMTFGSMCADQSAPISAIPDRTAEFLRA
jgi:hypothetical protein